MLVTKVVNWARYNILRPQLLPFDSNVYLFIFSMNQWYTRYLAKTWCVRPVQCLILCSVYTVKVSQSISFTLSEDKRFLGLRGETFLFITQQETWTSHICVGWPWLAQVHQGLSTGGYYNFSRFGSQPRCGNSQSFKQCAGKPGKIGARERYYCYHLYLEGNISCTPERWHYLYHLMSFAIQIPL